MKKILLIISMFLVANSYAQQQIYFTTFPAANPPSGWNKEIIMGEYNWYFGEIVLPGSTIFSEPAAVFNDDITGEQGNEAVLTSPSWNVSGYETVALSYEYGLNRAGGGGILTVEVYDGSAWQEVAAYDESQTPVTIEPLDVTAYKNAAFSVRFTYNDEFTFSMGAGITNFLLEGTYIVAPNSECWNAVLLNCGSEGEGSTVGSTIKDELAPHGGLDPNGSYGVWYKYSDIGNQSDVTFSLCDTTEVFDSKIIVYQGACADLFPIASNNDTCGTLSEVSFHNDGTTTYYILVFGEEQSVSDFNYSFSCQSGAPANDDIENAIDVDQFDQPYTDAAVSLINATMEADSADFLNTGCDMGGGWYPNVFYKFTAEQDGTATATFTTPNDGGFQIIGFYTAPDENASISNLAFVDQPSNGCNQMSETKSINITAGTVYYVVMMSPYTNSDVVININYQTVQNVLVTPEEGSEAEVVVGQTLQLEASVLPEGTNQQVTWSIENGDLFASVNDAGEVTGLAPGTVTVRATSVQDATVFGEIEVEVLEDLSVSDLNNASFTIYPNPVKDILNISGKTNISKIEVFELSGKKVISQNADAKNVQLSLSSLSGGTYIVKITSDSTAETFKIVKK